MSPHVVFTLSAAGSIREVLRQIGEEKAVIGFPDDLSYGPINPSSSLSRQAWIEETFDLDLGEWLQKAELFWERATSPEIVPIVWVCRNDPREFAAFLEFVWRRNDAVFSVVDITDAKVTLRDSESFTPLSLSILMPSQIIEGQLLDRKSALSANEVSEYRKLWQQLMIENAPIRVIDQRRLISAPITIFDDDLLSSVTEHWQNAARIVGETMARLLLASPGRVVGNMLLWARVRALASEGVLEIVGEGEERNSKVRRAPIKPIC
jgi:hypothetical protein